MSFFAVVNNVVLPPHASIIICFNLSFIFVSICVSISWIPYFFFVTVFLQ